MGELVLTSQFLPIFSSESIRYKLSPSVSDTSLFGAFPCFSFTSLLFCVLEDLRTRRSSHMECASRVSQGTRQQKTLDLLTEGWPLRGESIWSCALTVAQEDDHRGPWCNTQSPGGERKVSEALLSWSLVDGDRYCYKCYKILLCISLGFQQFGWVLKWLYAWVS